MTAMARLTILALFGLFLAFLHAAPARAETVGFAGSRVALVVGIGDYDEVPDLPNAITDARTIAAELWRSGFEVVELLDADINTLRASLRVVSERLKPQSQVTFFFAGHGIQVDDQNFLLARDVRLDASVDEALRAAVSANEITNTFAGSDAALTIVILDACRNNPFAQSGMIVADNQRGLVMVDGAEADGLAPITVANPAEVLIAFATSPGGVAFDGPEGGNSPFTSAVVDNLRTPALPVSEVFANVREDVRQLTGGSQEPWISDRLSSPFIFREGMFDTGRGADNMVDTLGLLPPTLIMERSLWRTAQASGALDDYALYLAQFPDGAYADLAREGLEAARSGTAIATPEAAQAADGSRAAVLAAGTRFPLVRAVSPELLAPLTRITVAALPEGITLHDGTGRALGLAEPYPAAVIAGAFLQVPARLAGDAGRLVLRDADGNSQDIVHEVFVDYDTCDLVAGYPNDPNRVGRGARLELMDPLLAIAACQSALARFPDEPRFKALLARAYRSGEDFGTSRAWNAAAIADGYSAAIAAEGKMLLLGQGTPVDLAGSAAHFGQAADMGDTWGMTGLGEAYIHGWGVAPDPARGVDLIRAAAGSGNDWAHTLMGRLHETGDGVAQSDAAAFDWFRSGAAMGEPQSKLRLAMAYKHGRGVAADPAEAARWLESAAGQGWPFAQARFGLEHATGEILPRDLETAVYWYRRAAARNEPEGQYLLALALLDGAGVERDTDHALALLHLVRARGHVQAIIRLAELAETGEVAPPDPQAAFTYQREAFELGAWHLGRRVARGLAEGVTGTIEADAAVMVLTRTIDETGDTYAMRDLARVHAEGVLVPQDAVTAAGWMRRAAEAGNIHALRDHALNLEKGAGVATDPQAAHAAMARAAAAGVAWARMDLARFHLQGIGTQVSEAEAAHWFARAAALDDASARELARERAARLPAPALAQGMGFLRQSADGAEHDPADAATRGAARIAQAGIDPANAAAVLDLLFAEAALIE